mmetsp:Transcript_80286/g.126623  ORF Transcript_80286/g.126623 Transcript_80286/m.126623 type:complete len:279 (+) Transcript_80286:64-900(+)
MVVGHVLSESLHDLLGQDATCKSHVALETICPNRTGTRAVTSFGEAGGGEGKKGSLTQRMGRTEDDVPCECTDPIKKKKKKLHNKVFTKLGFGSGINRDHQAVFEELEKQQLKAERKNANLAVKGPMKSFNNAAKKLTKAITKTEHHYSEFRARQDDYLKAYLDVEQAMNVHCKGMRMKYKGIRLDCERERQEAQLQFFARRHNPECLIGNTTPFKNLHGDKGLLSVLADLPPEIVAAGELIRNSSFSPVSSDRFLPTHRPEVAVRQPKRTNVGASFL